MNTEGKFILSLVRMLLVAYVVITLADYYTTVRLSEGEAKTVCEVRV